jgi:hypothetical protein
MMSICIYCPLNLIYILAPQAHGVLDVQGSSTDLNAQTVPGENDETYDDTVDIDFAT